MKIILYLVILALMLAIPVDRLDIAKLEPVEAVAVYTHRGQVFLVTDTGAKGSGNTAHEALLDMKEKTPAVIYLDTADYLMVAKGADSAAQELLTVLKPGIKQAQYRGGDVKEETKYLSAHQEKWKPEN